MTKMDEFLELDEDLDEYVEWLEDKGKALIQGYLETE